MVKFKNVKPVPDKIDCTAPHIICYDTVLRNIYKFPRDYFLEIRDKTLIPLFTLKKDTSDGLVNYFCMAAVENEKITEIGYASLTEYSSWAFGEEKPDKEYIAIGQISDEEDWEEERKEASRIESLIFAYDNEVEK